MLSWSSSHFQSHFLPISLFVLSTHVGAHLGHEGEGSHCFTHKCVLQLEADVYVHASFLAQVSASTLTLARFHSPHSPRSSFSLHTHPGQVSASTLIQVRFQPPHSFRSARKAVLPSAVGVSEHYTLLFPLTSHRLSTLTHVMPLLPIQAVKAEAAAVSVRKCVLEAELKSLMEQQLLDTQEGGQGRLLAGVWERRGLYQRGVNRGVGSGVQG